MNEYNFHLAIESKCSEAELHFMVGIAAVKLGCWVNRTPENK